jgi:hypothetical protein
MAIEQKQHLSYQTITKRKVKFCHISMLEAAIKGQATLKIFGLYNYKVHKNAS